MSEIVEMDNITAGYQSTVVLERVSLSMAQKSVTAVLGRNGAGKTTLLSTIMGLTRVDTGTLRFNGQDLIGVPIHHRVRRGITLVPQEREIFPSLTVDENLQVAVRGRGDWTIGRIYDLFPILHRRRSNYGHQLSGGEQQMLAVGRALVGNPLLLLMDEPFEGLAPVIIDTLVDAFTRIRTESALAIMLVEHNVDLALDLADRAVILERGQVAWEGECAHLRDNRGQLAGLISLQEVATSQNAIAEE